LGTRADDCQASAWYVEAKVMKGEAPPAGGVEMQNIGFPNSNELWSNYNNRIRRWTAVEETTIGVTLYDKRPSSRVRR
jgi:hypothetical protein